MRTTLVLEDGLIEAAKKRAAERKATLSDVVNDALRELFLRRERVRKTVRLPTAGDPRKRRRVSPREIAEALLEHP